MATKLYYNPFIPAFSNIGVAIAQSQLFFYYTATTTLAPIYADAAATVPLTNPVVANLAGKYPDVYLDAAITYRVEQKDKTGAPIGDAVDPYYPGTIVAAADPGLRIDLANAVSPKGGTLVGYRHSSTATSTTVTERLAREIWAEDYGFKTTNTGAQNTTAINLAIAAMPATGGTIRIGAGTFVVNEIRLPSDPKVIDIQGSGIRATILQMGTPNGPMITRDAVTFGAGRITGARIGHFTVQAHTSSDKTNLLHRAINFTGFGKSVFHDIAYLAAASNASVGCIFYADSKNGSTYNNVLERIQVAATSGPSRVLRLSNDGLGSLGNPNLTEFRDSWIYACSGINLIADCLDSTRTRIDNVLFEDCPGATGVGLGQNTVVTGCWFELLAANITTNSAASVDGSSSVIIGNYFSGAGTSFIDTINQKPLWIGNAGGGQTITGVGVTKIEGFAGNPAAPTLARTAGLTGNPTLVAATVQSNKDALGYVTFRLVYDYTPASAGWHQLGLTLPSGYTLVNFNCGATRNANGIPATSALDTNVLQVNLGYAGADSHRIVALVTIKET